jgi:hypothetical protein
MRRTAVQDLIGGDLCKGPVRFQPSLQEVNRSALLAKRNEQKAFP